MDREKFWGALVKLLEENMYEAEAMGKIVAIVMVALAHAEGAEG